MSYIIKLLGTDVLASPCFLTRKIISVIIPAISFWKLSQISIKFIYKYFLYKFFLKTIFREKGNFIDFWLNFQKEAVRKIIEISFRIDE